MLKEVKIELTNRCDRNCKHCSSSATNSSNNIKELDLYITDMTDDEKAIVKAGCLINYNRNRKENK